MREGSLNPGPDAVEARPEFGVVGQFAAGLAVFKAGEVGLEAAAQADPQMPGAKRPRHQVVASVE